MPDKYTFDDLVKIMAILRSPSGCPWDREQTHQSLTRHLIEEAYEVVDAIEKGDLSHLREELGDLLLQIIFHAQMASEEGKFTIGEIIDDLVVKLKRRHPHIFSDLKVSSAQEVITHWEKIKKQEKERTILAGIPKSLPALLYAFMIQGKARRVGFDWEKSQDILEKLDEEVEEFKKAILEEGDIEDEVGDLLFTVVNIARHFDIDPETALRRVANKFYTRFEEMEKIAQKEGRDFEEMSLEEKDKLWERAKKSSGGL